MMMHVYNLCGRYVCITASTQMHTSTDRDLVFGGNSDYICEHPSILIDLYTQTAFFSHPAQIYTQLITIHMHLLYVQ